MKDKAERIDPLPDEFASYEEAAEYWDAHDTTDYLDASHPVNMVSEFRGRYYAVEIEESVMQILRAQAKSQGVSSDYLATKLLRKELQELEHSTAGA